MKHILRPKKCHHSPCGNHAQQSTLCKIKLWVNGRADSPLAKPAYTLIFLTPKNKLLAASTTSLPPIIRALNVGCK